MPHIEISTHSNCKADTKKTKNTKKQCFSIGKFNQKKKQLKRDLKDDTIL